MNIPTFDQVIAEHNKGLRVFDGIYPVIVRGKKVDNIYLGFNVIETTKDYYPVQTYFEKTGVMPAKPYLKTVMGREPKKFEKWEQENTVLYQLIDNKDKIRIQVIEKWSNYPYYEFHLKMGAMIHYSSKNIDWMPFRGIHQLW